MNDRQTRGFYNVKLDAYKASILISYRCVIHAYNQFSDPPTSPFYDYHNNALIVVEPFLHDLMSDGHAQLWLLTKPTSV